MGDIKTCATCRGPLRDIARYGRLVRRALLDESTKKLILFLNRGYIPLAMELPQLIQELQGAIKRGGGGWPTTTKIDGTREHQVGTMRRIVKNAHPHRWDAILNLRKRIEEYRQRVKPQKQPFQKISDMVESSRRRKRTTGSLEVKNDVLQTKGVLQATALGLRLHIALFADFVSLTQRVRVRETKIQMSLGKTMDECESLITAAATSNRLSQQVEGHVFLVQLFALERAHLPSSGAKEDHLSRARTSILEARRLCSEFPGQTQGLAEEISNAEQMLNGGTFYAAVTNEERMVVIAAMAREFHGTGHWYYCRNGHPFTIGECGGAMETSSCPECGAPVGGHDHETAEGVTRADDFERDFRRMDL